MSKKYIDIEKFNRLDINLEYKDIINKYAKEAVKKLKSVSPSGNRKNNKYKDTWAVRISKYDDEYEAMVWNEKNWQLTHLLENGHQIVNKKNGVGWASGNPHIKPTYDQIKPKFIKAMTKDVKVEIK